LIIPPEILQGDQGMPLPRRSFLKSVTISTLSAGLAFASAKLVFGQGLKDGETGPRIPFGRPVTQVDVGDYFPVPIEAQQDALFYFRPATFNPYVGDIFQVPNAVGQMITLTLTRVSEYKMKSATRIATKKTRQPQSFSLTFSAAEPLPPFTSIHRMSHPALGSFDLFLTSHEPESGAFVYVAVFNHLQ
jgi:hypothetical protein